MRKVITMTVLCLMVFLMVVFMVSCSKNTSSDLAVNATTTGTISGKVVTSDTGIGVGQAVISLGGSTVATTATDGTFIVAGVRQGNEQIVATRGQDVGSTTVAITAGEVSEATITIISQVTNTVSAQNVRVVGRMVDAVSGEGIDGVAVQITDVGKATMTTLWNSSIADFATFFPQNVPEQPAGPNGPEHHGYFYFENVTPGVHTFKFSKTGYFDKQISMDISTTQRLVNETMVYDPKATGMIAGYVSFDADGLLAGDTANNDGSFNSATEWKASLSLDTGQTTTTVDIDGKVGYFKFENIPPRHLIYQNGVLIDPGYTLTALTTRTINNVPVSFQGQVIHIEVDESKTTISNVKLGGGSLNTNVNPAIQLPAANDMVTAATPLFQWEALSVTTSYVVKVFHIVNADPNTGLGGVTTEVMMERTVNNANTYTYDGTDLMNNEWYALKVFSMTNGVLSSGTGIRFKKVPFLIPTRVAPLDNDQTDPNETILAWNNTDSGGNYVVQLYTTSETAPATGADFSRVIWQYETASAAETNVKLTNSLLLPSKVYWWAVAQKNPADNSPVEFATVTDTSDIDKDGNTAEQVIDCGYFRTAPQPGVPVNPTGVFSDSQVTLTWTDPVAPQDLTGDAVHANHWHHVYVDAETTPRIIYANTTTIGVSNDVNHTLSIATVNQYGVESRLVTVTGTPGTPPAVTFTNWTVSPNTANLAVNTAGSINTSVSFTVNNLGGQAVTGLSVAVTAVGPGSGTDTLVGTVNLSGKGSVNVTIPLTVSVNANATAGQTAVFSFVGTATGGTSQTGTTGISGGGASGTTGLTVTYF
ncbi:MAG: hypothetical protein CVV64_08485 [Candidatus Wallbacteria bacterium HGW-Wallbacteria-1]|jgi:hypothetical protein|uniref:Uncharacterized protein n=1 Tax=Candidatus Wallbacteria bacterium HGW-Wallbacteria-1 TaxID=2013854 RepID=A0A2N1PPY5_9BACT|nr:MAG: hypothetical protein CVV64_08485 [Candidatus Wallbacteria bacterium HGW-Wallbacteria-1]